MNFKEGWINLHGEECKYLGEVIDGQNRLIAYKKRDMGGYHWSHHLEIDQAIVLTRKSKSINSLQK